MNIRPMRVDDLSRVMEIAHSLPQAPRWTSEAYARAVSPVAAPARIAMVAELSEPASGVVGFLVAVLVPPQAELESIAVARAAQGQGIAHRLCTELFDILKTSQITEVMLEVRASNRAALALYASFGFRETGRRAAYYSEPKEDAILLRRMLA